ncbi:MAG: hypothetical protein KDJ88_13100 [Bauldia sp.]|nr:hypothetical protein [Bauldia sp.]
MNRFRVILLVLLAPLLLTACFTSETPLIGPKDAVFPYETIVFRSMDRPEDRQTWDHSGDIYRFAPDGGDKAMSMRLKPIGDDLFVVQMEGPDDKPPAVLYALLKVDIANMTAESHSAIMPDDFEPTPGLSVRDDMVRVDDLDAYIAYARARMAAGVPADVVYKIIALE